MIEPIKLEGERTVADFEAAQQMARGRVLVVDLIFVVAGLSWIGIGLAAKHYPLFGLGVGAVVYGGVMRKFLLHRRLRREWARFPLMHKPFCHVFSEDGVFSGREEEPLPWEDFIKWRKGKGVILLFLSPHNAMFLPRRLMSEQQEADLCRLFEEKIGEKKG